MNRLQKKCVLASVCMHGLLCLVLLVGPALMTRQVDDSPTVITLVNATVTDAPSGGGTAGPVASPPPAELPAKPPAAQPELSQPKPEPLKKIEDTKPIEPPAPKAIEKPKAEEILKVPDGEMKLAPVPKKKVDPATTAVQDSLKRPIVPAKKAETKFSKAPPKVDLGKVVKRNTRAIEDERAAADAEKAARAAEQRRQQLLAGLGKSASNIQRNTSKASTVEATGGGDGSGGIATINYRQYVAARYKSEYDEVLVKAAGIAAGDLFVRATVTINSSGRIVGSEITTKSGNKELDRLVQRVLDGVKQVDGFPKGAQDSERKFNLRFQLDAESRQG